MWWLIPQGDYVFMAKPIDPQLKQEIMNSVKSGMTQLEASRLYGVSSKTISAWCRQDVCEMDKSRRPETPHPCDTPVNVVYADAKPDRAHR